MSTLSKRERTLVALMVGVALVVGVPGLLLTGGREPGPSLEAERERHAGIRTELAEVREEVASLKSRMGGRIVPGTPRLLVPRMVQAVHRAARAAGIRVDDLKPVPDQRESELKRVAVQVTASAPFPRAVRFLYELDRQSSRYGVEQLSMDAANREADELQLELRLVAYVRSEEADAVP
ncbi:MAG: GspMb/PilO family protein [Armatimonadota bacterium]